MTDAACPIDTFPNIDEDQFQPTDPAALFDAPRATHPPRILMLYGSLRERSYSRLATEEAARILRRLGAEVRIFNPSGLPLPDSAPADHPKVKELRELRRLAVLQRRQPAACARPLDEDVHDSQPELRRQGLQRV